MTYTWKYYLLVAHLVDENKHTACNRQLPYVYEVAGVVARKCATCQKFALKNIVTKEGKKNE